jgi:hypothetical protein
VPSSFLSSAPPVPGMRIAWRPHSQCVDRGVSAAEQSPQVGAAEGEADRLLRPAHDADAPAVECHNPDTAWASAVDPAEAVDLEPARGAGFAARVWR